MQHLNFDQKLRDLMVNRIGRFEFETIDNSELRAAAVAIVVTQDPELQQASVLLTLRPRQLNRHSGQYALPGGRLDDGETEVDAALRELREELGLTLEKDSVLGRLDDFPTRSGFRVSPFVMWHSGACDLVPDPSEVSRVFHIPMAEFDSADIPQLQESKNSEHPVMSAFFPTLGHDIFAPTAAILYQFREIALRGTSTRVSHFDQPAFAWK